MQPLTGYDSASANIKTNLTELQVLGQLWDSDIILNAFDNVSLNTTTANSGNLIGNRVFYANDYAVCNSWDSWDSKSRKTPLTCFSGATGTWLCHNSSDVLQAYPEYRMH